MFWKRLKPLPTKEELDKREDLPLEKGDLGAMLVAALLVYLPALIIFAVVIVGIVWLFFYR